MQRAPLTDRLRLEELRGAVFTLALAIDGRQLHFVPGLWLQPCDSDLTDRAC